MKSRLIAIAIDGTCVEHMYPALGPTVLHAPRVLSKLAAAGHRLVIYTMRDSKPHDKSVYGTTLLDATKWFDYHKIPFVAANENAPGADFSQSRKVYASLYIDDAALGCPLMPGNFGDRPMVDWLEVERWLKTHGYLEL